MLNVVKLVVPILIFMDMKVFQFIMPKLWWLLIIIWLMLNYQLSKKFKLIEYGKFNYLTTYF